MVKEFYNVKHFYSSKIVNKTIHILQRSTQKKQNKKTKKKNNIK